MLKQMGKRNLSVSGIPLPEAKSTAFGSSLDLTVMEYDIVQVVLPFRKLQHF